MSQPVREIREGVDGSGKTIWLVNTFNSAGQCIWIEYFRNRAEAECWMKWA